MKVAELLEKYKVKSESELSTEEQKTALKKIRDQADARRKYDRERMRKNRSKAKEDAPVRSKKRKAEGQSRPSKRARKKDPLTSEEIDWMKETNYFLGRQNA